MADETHEVDLIVTGIRVTVPKKNISQFNWQLLPAQVSNVELIVQSPKGGALALYNPETDTIRKYVPANHKEPVAPPKGDAGAGGNTGK